MAATYSNTLGALNGIAGSLEAILNYVAPKNENSKDKSVQIKDLSTTKGPIGTSNQVPTEKSGKIETTKVNIADVSSTASIFAVIKASKGIKEKDAQRVKGIFIEFGKGVSALSKSMDNVNVEKLNTIKGLSNTLELIPNIVLKISALGVIAPLFTLSAALLLPGFLVLGKGLNTLSKIGNSENLKNANDALFGIGKFAMQMTIVTGLIVGLAIVVAKSKDVVTEGLGIVLGIFGGLILTATIVLLSSRYFAAADKAFISIGTFLAEMTVVTGILIGLSAIVGLGKEIIQEGLGTIIGIFGGLVLTATVIMLASKHFTMADKGLLTVGTFMMEIAIVTAMIVGVGLLVTNYKEEALLGFAAFTLILSEAAGLALLASKLKPTVEKGALAMFTIGKLMLVSVGVVAAVVGLGMLIKAVSNGDLVTWGSMGIAFAGITAVLLSSFAIAKLAQRIKSTAEKGANAMLSSAKVILASAGVVAAIIGVSMLMQSSGVTWDDLGKTLLAMGGVLLATAVLAKVATKITKNAKKGIAAMALAELLIGGSLVVVLGMAKLSQYVTNTLGGWSDIFVCLGAMASVVTAFGALAAAAGMIAGQIALGGAVLLECELVAGASLLVILGMVKTIEAVRTLGDPTNENAGAWAQIFTCLGAMASVVAAFGVLAGAAGLIAPIIAVGGAALLECTILAGASTSVIFSLISVINAVKKLDEETNGAGWSTIKDTIDKIDANVLSPFEDISKSAAVKSGSIKKGAKALLSVIDMSMSTSKMILNLVSLQILLKEHPVEELTNIATNISTILSSFSSVAEEAGEHAKRVKNGAESLKSVIDLSHTFNTLITELTNLPAINQDETSKYFNALNAFVTGIVNPVSEIKRLNAAKQITGFNNSLNKLMRATIKSTDPKITKNITQSGDAIFKLKQSLDNFDKVLLKNPDARVRAINNLKDAIEKLTKAFTGTDTDKATAFLKSVSDTLNTIDGSSTDKINKVITALKQLTARATLLSPMPAAGGMGGFGGINPEQLSVIIEDAITRGLDNTYIEYTYTNNKLSSAWLDTIDKEGRIYNNNHTVD